MKHYDMVLLSCKNLDVRYDGVVKAFSGISIDVYDGEFVSIIGANGAGKSTVLKAISGINKPHAGEIWYKDKRIDGIEPDEILKNGITYCPESRHIFPNMSVEDNLKIGALIRNDNTGIKADIKKMYERFPVLGRKRHQHASQISGAQQMLLSIGRSLMSRPKLLLIDEPSQGMSPLVIKDIAEILQKINDEGTTVLLVDQNTKLCLKLANRAYLFEAGEIVLKGDATEMAENPMLQRSYLGVD